MCWILEQVLCCLSIVSRSHFCYFERNFDRRAGVNYATKSEQPSLKPLSTQCGIHCRWCLSGLYPPLSTRSIATLTYDCKVSNSIHTSTFSSDQRSLITSSPAFSLSQTSSSLIIFSSLNDRKHLRQEPVHFPNRQLSRHQFSLNPRCKGDEIHHGPNSIQRWDPRRSREAWLPADDAGAGLEPWYSAQLYTFTRCIIRRSGWTKQVEIKHHTFQCLSVQVHFGFRRRLWCLLSFLKIYSITVVFIH